MKKTKKPQEFPPNLCVAKENEGTEDEYFATEERIIDLATLDGRRRVGLYKLDRVVTVRALVEVTGS